MTHTQLGASILEAFIQHAKEAKVRGASRPTYLTLRVQPPIDPSDVEYAEALRKELSGGYRTWQQLAEGTKSPHKKHRAIARAASSWRAEELDKRLQTLQGEKRDPVYNELEHTWQLIVVLS
jgi:hypothetical protein